MQRIALTSRAVLERGFTMVEALVVIAIIGTLVAVGVPSMRTWLVANKAAGASEFYVEGFRMARLQALGHKAASRIVLSQNGTNGQMDWQVDLCFPTPGTPCSNVSGSWSTLTDAAPGDPEGSAGYKSVFRTASSLPDTTVLTPSLLPDGAFSVYYTALGWVDTSFAARLTSIRFDPASAYAADILPSAVVVTLAGIATRCVPTLAVTDSRGCRP